MGWVGQEDAANYGIEVARQLHNGMCVELDHPWSLCLGPALLSAVGKAPSIHRRWKVGSQERDQGKVGTARLRCDTSEQRRKHGGSDAMCCCDLLRDTSRHPAICSRTEQRCAMSSVGLQFL